MTVNYSQALDEIFALFNTRWSAETAAITGAIPIIYWQGIEPRDIPDRTKYWCRVSTQQVSSPQSTHRIGIAPSEQRRYTATGLLFVQVFSPRSAADAAVKGRLLAQIAQKAFRGQQTAGGVWFRNVVINELPPEDDWYVINVTADYEYDDIA